MSGRDSARSAFDSRNRRRFLGLVGASAVPLIAGCSGNSDENSGGGTPRKDRHGGQLRVSATQSPQTLNPVMANSAEAYMVGQWLYSNLTKLGDDLTVQKDLATDWEHSDDLKQWEFSLREDATFQHNGNNVLAEDVVATIETVYDPDVGSPGEGALGPIDSAEVVNDQRVRINMSQPYTVLPKALTSPWGRIIPKDVVKDNRDDLATEDFGSGPFALESFSVGDEVTVSRNDDYYETDDDGNALPYVSKTTLKVQPEAVTATTALGNEEVDILSRVPVAQYQRVSNESNASISKTPSGWCYPIVMRTTAEPFDDIKVRHAIKYGTDKKNIIEGAVQGHGVVGQDNPIAPPHEFYADLDDKFGQEARPDEAQRLLEEAGYPDGIDLDFKLYVTPDHKPPMGQTAVLFQDQMKNIGIDFEIQQVTWDRFISEIETQVEFYITSFGLRIIESKILTLFLEKDHIFYGSMWHEGQPEAYGEFTDMLDEVSTVTDAGRKQELYEKIQRLARDRAGVVVPFHPDMIGARNDYVKEWSVHPTGLKMPLEDVYLSGDAPTVD